MSSTVSDRNNPCFRWTNIHFQFGPFSHTSSNKTSSNCLSHNNPTNGWPTNFVQGVPQDLQCLPRSLAICVGEDVSICLDILTSVFWAIWERPPILPGCKQIKYCMSCLSFTTWSWQQSSVMQMSFAQWRLRWLLNRPFQCLLWVRLCLYTFAILILALHFWGGICPSMKECALCFCLFVLPE